YFFFGYLILIAAEIEKTDYQIGSGAQQPYERRRNFAEHGHWPGNSHGELFGNHKADPFGHQLTEYERQESDDDHHQGHRYVFAVGCQQWDLLQELFEKG